MTVIRLRDHLHRRRTVSIAALLVLVLAGSTWAVAEEGDPPLPPVDEESTDPEPIVYLPDDDLIVFSLPDENGDFVDCSGARLPEDVPEGGDGTAIEEIVEPAVEDDDATAESVALPTDTEGCHAASTLGPNGQSNHGQAVRAFVDALKELEFDGPRGNLVRNAAKSGIGKAAEEDGEGGETLDAQDADDGEPTTHRGRGKAKGKNK